MLFSRDKKMVSAILYCEEEVCASSLLGMQGVTSSQHERVHANSI